MPPEYSIPLAPVYHLVHAILFKHKRCFSEDARVFIKGIKPPVMVLGNENIPYTGRSVITINHYSRPGFGAWWLSIAVSATISSDVKWVMTSRWTFQGKPFRKFMSSISRIIITRIANVYGFFSMPPMPPTVEEIIERSLTVRKVLSAARNSDNLVLGIAPEGQDHHAGILNWPPTGVGRFLLHLADLDYKICPVGAFENEDTFCIKFGKPYHLEVPPGISPEMRDHQAREIIMRHIALQLPERLNGEFYC